MDGRRRTPLCLATLGQSRGLGSGVGGEEKAHSVPDKSIDAVRRDDPAVFKHKAIDGKPFRPNEIKC